MNAKEAMSDAPDMPDTEVTGEMPIASGVWEINPTHSSVTMSCRWMLAPVRGRFKSFHGNVTLADAPADSTVVATIDTGSIDTGAESRDEHLIDADFLDAAQFPTATFVSTALQHVEGRAWTLTGDLTLHGVTNPIVLDLEVQGMATSPFGKLVAGFVGTGELSRKAYDLTWNMPVIGGGFALSDKVTLQLDVELQQPSNE